MPLFELGALPELPFDPAAPAPLEPEPLEPAVPAPDPTLLLLLCLGRVCVAFDFPLTPLVAPSPLPAGSLAPTVAPAPEPVPVPLPPPDPLACAEALAVVVVVEVEELVLLVPTALVVAAVLVAVAAPPTLADVVVCELPPHPARAIAITSTVAYSDIRPPDRTTLAADRAMRPGPRNP